MPATTATRIVRLWGLTLLAFLVLMGWQSYWHLAKSEWLLDQPRNRRLARVETQIPRGRILDRHGAPLAWTENRTRHYAAPAAAAAVIGYLDPRFGREGVEGAWNPELSGLTRTFTADEFARIQRGEKREGKDIMLTLDLPLQQAAAKALGDRKGAVAILDPATGAILALVTAPSYNSATFGDDYARLVAREDSPLINRATQGLYPPGSTMKVLTAAAALMHGVDADATHRCEGKSRVYGVNISDYHGATHGTLAMAKALSVSCNHYFAKTAAELGDVKFTETAAAFGFGADWWQRLPDARMLPLQVKPSSLQPTPGRIGKGELAHMGFGQSTVLATPLQMAMIAGAVANDGTVMAPYLVKSVQQRDGAVLRAFTSLPVGLAMSKESANTLTRMMRGVVTGGTARRANTRAATVYGKTGTAEQTGGEDHAWFIGFAEDHERQIALAVLVERGGTGGQVAVPIARQVIEAWANAE